MKKYLLLCLIVAGALPGLGQGRDTAFAVHKLFVQRRGGGDTWAATGLTAAVDESIGRRSISNSATHSNVASAAVFGGVPFVLGMSQAVRFSQEREAAILKSYAEGWPIPFDIRRKLRRRHFHRTAHDVLLAPH